MDNPLDDFALNQLQPLIFFQDTSRNHLLVMSATLPRQDRGDFKSGKLLGNPMPAGRTRFEP